MFSILFQHVCEQTFRIKGIYVKHGGGGDIKGKPIKTNDRTNRGDHIVHSWYIINFPQVICLILMQ